MPQTSELEEFLRKDNGHIILDKTYVGRVAKLDDSVWKVTIVDIIIESNLAVVRGNTYREGDDPVFIVKPYNLTFYAHPPSPQSSHRASL